MSAGLTSSVCCQWRPIPSALHLHPWCRLCHARPLGKVSSESQPSLGVHIQLDHVTVTCSANSPASPQDTHRSSSSPISISVCSSSVLQLARQTASHCTASCCSSCLGKMGRLGDGCRGKDDCCLSHPPLCNSTSTSSWTPHSCRPA